LRNSLVHVLDDVSARIQKQLLQSRALRAGPDAYRRGTRQPQIHSWESDDRKTIELTDIGQGPGRAPHLIIVRRNPGKRFTLNFGRKWEAMALTRSGVTGWSVLWEKLAGSDFRSANDLPRNTFLSLNIWSFRKIWVFT
jgi:hypothetical protein